MHFRLCHVADGHGRKEIGLAFDRGCRLAGLEIGCGCGSTEIVGEGHEGSAVQDSKPVIELIARDKLCRYPLGRYVRDFQAEEFGKGRLLVGRFVHLLRSQPSSK